MSRPCHLNRLCLDSTTGFFKPRQGVQKIQPDKDLDPIRERIELQQLLQNLKGNSQPGGRLSCPHHSHGFARGADQHSTSFLHVDRSEIRNWADHSGRTSPLHRRGAASEKFPKRLPVTDMDWPIRTVSHRGIVTNAQQVENCRTEFLRQHTSRLRIRSTGVARTINLPTGNAGSGQGTTEYRSPVIASSLGIELRRPPEFANRHDQRFFQQSSHLEILEQRAETTIKLRTKTVLHPVVVVSVRVPHRTARGQVAGLPWPLDMDKPNPRLDQPPRQQDTLPPLATTITISKFCWLPVNRKC